MTETFAQQPWLSTIMFLPLIGALLIIINRLLARGDEEEIVAWRARWIAMFTTLVTFAVSFGVYYLFYDPVAEGYQLVETIPWLGKGIAYKVGVDGISILFVLLTTFFLPICILASWKSVNKRVADFMIAFLVLESFMIGTFTALDLLLFYVFFEAGLIPMFILIGVWGSEGSRQFLGREIPARVYAAFKFFLFTLVGSVLLLVALMWIYGKAGTTDIVVLQNYEFSATAQKWLWLAFFASFAVKIPMWPVHTWLPDAHVQAPTGASVVLAAIMLKMGGYGFIRFSLPMFPLASADFQIFIFSLSVIAIIYTSLVAFAQEDMKKLIAYSSVAHMGFVTMGLFSGTEQGMEGALFQMLSHGFISGALFLCVGVLYDRMHTREIAFYGGLVTRMKLFAFVFMVFTMANIGLPGLSGFVGEILPLIGTYEINSWTAIFATSGVIFSAAYGLRLYREVMMGTITNEKLATINDLDRRETFILGLLVLIIIFFGVNPTPTLMVFSPAVDSVLEIYNTALAAASR